MEIRIDSIPTVAPDAWKNAGDQQENAKTIRPVPKTEKSGELKVDAKKPPQVEIKDSGGKDLQKSRRQKSGQEGQEVNREEIYQMAEDIQSYLENLDVRLNFKIYEETGDFVVQVMDPESEEIIKQIPPEDMLKLREKLEELQGILFSEKV